MAVFIPISEPIPAYVANTLLSNDGTDLLWSNGLTWDYTNFRLGIGGAFDSEERVRIEGNLKLNGVTPAVIFRSTDGPSLGGRIIGGKLPDPGGWANSYITIGSAHNWTTFNDELTLRNGVVYLNGNVVIGTGAAGIDYTLTINGESDDCVITYDEDNNILNFGDTNITITGLGTFGNLQVDGININGQRIGSASTIYVDSGGYEIVSFSYADGIRFNYGMTIPLGYPIHFFGDESDCWIEMEDEYRLDITVPGEIRLNASTLLLDKLMFTQTDGNEYIDSLADGYMDYGATIAHRFNSPVLVSQSSSTGAKPVLQLSQLDVSEEFIRFIGTAAAGVGTQSLVKEGFDAIIEGYIKVYIQDNGDDIADGAYYIPFYSLYVP